MPDKTALKKTVPKNARWIEPRRVNENERVRIHGPPSCDKPPWLQGIMSGLFLLSIRQSGVPISPALRENMSVWLPETFDPMNTRSSAQDHRGDAFGGPDISLHEGVNRTQI